MAPSFVSLICTAILASQVFALPERQVTTRNESASVIPFQVNLSAGVPRMLELIQERRLPDEPEYPGVGSTKGIDLDLVKILRKEWLDEFDWDKEEAYLNSFDQFTTEIEGRTVHFVHHASSDPKAIPLLLLHGWPGSFMEFLPVVAPLTQPATTSTGESVSFNVVIPSLPGFAFSDKPLNGSYTLDDTARIFDTLMTDKLGYSKYGVHGTSNGMILAFTLFDKFNVSARAAHFPLLPFYSTTDEELVERKITLSPLEEVVHERAMEWTFNGTGYFLTQINNPNTIGIAVNDDPIGQLAWAGEKWFKWSDPNFGQAPSVLTHNEILRSISLSFLTGTFISSIYTYAQDPNLPYIEGIIKRAHNDGPLMVTYFKYAIGFWPEEVLRLMGNLVSYRTHETGGFFAGLENPPALVEDLREIKTHWIG